MEKEETGQGFSLEEIQKSLAKSRIKRRSLMNQGFPVHKSKKKDKKRGEKARKKDKKTEEKPKKSSKRKNHLEDERIPTGIENFDRLIEGGFEKDSTNLLVGSSGSGKSIFATQFLIEGLKRDEKCLYITFEEKKEEFYENMGDFGWDLEKEDEGGNFVFLEYTPEKVRAMLEEGGGIIENIILKKNVTRVVIDSITSFELLFETDIEKREAALALFNMLSKWNCTSLLTYEGEPSRERTVASRTLEFESDSIILMYFLRQKKLRERFLEILKMRGTNHSREIHPFKISDKGIVVSKEEFEGKLKNT